MTADATASISPVAQADAPAPLDLSALPLTPPQQPDRGSRSFIRQVVIDTTARLGARIGLAWIAVMAVLAVLAPFLANSLPFLVKTSAGWSSPLLRNLTPIDVLLLAISAVILTLAATRRLSPGKSAWVILGALIVATPLCFAFVTPQKNIVWEEYRVRQSRGELRSVWWTVVPYSPSDRNREVRELNHPVAPSRTHWMGTERNGGDLLSQMIHATRIALSIGFISTGIAVIIGCVIGGLMGYFAGSVDLLGMRLIEIFEAIPRLMILLAVAALIGPNLYLLMVVIGLTGWTGDARFIRAEFLKLRKQDFVQAAIASGLPLRSILFRHILPNGITPVLVTSSFGVASAILLESTLSFLGLGNPDQPSWGQLLNQARSGGAGFHWWIAIFPGLAIFLTVFSYNLVGQAIRDAMDPRLLKRD